MMNNLTFGFNNMSQVLSIFLGLIVLMLAFYMFISGNHPSELISWSLSILGLSFIHRWCQYVKIASKMM